MHMPFYRQVAFHRVSYTTVGLTIPLLVHTFPSQALALGNGAVINT